MRSPSHLREVIATRAYRDPRTERLLERLDAGEPVEVPSWMLRRWLPELHDINRVLIGPDGAVTPVESRSPTPDNVVTLTR